MRNNVILFFPEWPLLKNCQEEKKRKKNSGGSGKNFVTWFTRLLYVLIYDERKGQHLRYDNFCLRTGKKGGKNRPTYFIYIYRKNMLLAPTEISSGILFCYRKLFIYTEGNYSFSGSCILDGWRRKRDSCAIPCWVRGMKNVSELEVLYRKVVEGRVIM